MIRLVSREFVLLVVIANVLAWPVAYYAMRMWLGGFAYHVGISILIFIGAGGIAVVIALLTVSYQSAKASLANPVQSLRYE